MRTLGGLAGMLAGGALLCSVLIVMNRKQHHPEKTRASLLADIKVEKQKKEPKRPQRVQKRPPKRRVRSTAAPRPMLATDMSGLSVGAPVFQLGDLDQLGTDLLDSQQMSRDMVLTESAVDAPPKPTDAPSPRYPPRARAKGIEGFVKVRLLVGDDGSVRKVKVLESEPEGIFEDAVLAVVRAWRFEPATYQGQPVALAVNRRLSFKLN